MAVVIMHSAIYTLLCIYSVGKDISGTLIFDGVGLASLNCSHIFLSSSYFSLALIRIHTIYLMKMAYNEHIIILNSCTNYQ